MSEQRGTVHDLGYRRYLGSRRAQNTRWRSVVKNMLRMAWRGWWQAKVWIIAAATMVFALGFAMILAVDRVQKLTGPMAGAAESQMAKALNTALAQSFQWLPWVAFVLTMTAVGRTVARDLSVGAFEFYFSRPVRPIDYVLGKLGGAFVLVGAQLLLGPLLLAIFRVSIDWENLSDTWTVIPESLVIGLVATTFFASVPLAISAMAQKPRNALITWAVLWVVVSGIARIVAEQTGISAFYIFDPYGLILGVTYGFYGWKMFALRALPPLGMSLGFLALYCSAAITVFYVRVASIQRAGIGGR